MEPPLQARGDSPVGIAHRDVARFELVDYTVLPQPVGAVLSRKSVSALNIPASAMSEGTAIVQGRRLGIQIVAGDTDPHIRKFLELLVQPRIDAEILEA